jgi:hypothetical protein
MYSEMEAHTIESSTAVIVLVAALLVIMLVTRRIARGKDFVAFQKAQ